ncbi:putative methyltransferase [Prunus yedoensis var. nudiflora]|uniref:Putative methyltransferase n=1 Tax=Prunus yedoensis var. nudiflora TaxID=2094558 RepID=A0A314Y3P0_PRUYE|nr:putative methyltransferase [Prunus yedoensis var. nudiflora]
MAGLFDKQADVYLEGRPTYPKEWYSKLAALTPHHTLAWDVGTGNGQAAISVAEHYEQVIGTDVSESQLQHAIPHPQIRYAHTPLNITDEEVIALVGGEDSVDLVTVAAAVHWFDLPKFYNLVSRVLKKPEGVLAVWTYSGIEVSPTFDPVMKRFLTQHFLFGTIEPSVRGVAIRHFHFLFKVSRVSDARGTRCHWTFRQSCHLKGF